MKRFFLLASLISTSLFSQTVPGYIPSNGLVGWWPFDGTALDLSGNLNNGTVYGASYASDRNGSANSSIQFDGVNDYVDVSANFFNNGWTNYTISLWFYLNSAQQTGASQCFINTIPHNGWAVGYNWPSNSNTIMHCKNANPGSNLWNVINPGNGQVTTSPIPLFSWHNLVIRRQGSTYEYYLNGSLINTKMISNQNSIITSWCGLRFGNITGPSNELLNGRLDDIGIWNRALTPAEIQTLYFGCTDTLAQNPTSATATVGTNATFTALSSASGATYQWQAKNGSSFVNVSNAGQFSGATSSTLTVTNVSSANNGLQVRCIVDHGDCLDTSDIAVLASCFSLTAQPIDQYVVAGNSATFSAATNDPACTYQWQTNAGFGFQNLSNAAQFSGVTGASLIVSSVFQANNNQAFRCLVSAGNCKDTTSEARIILSGVGLNESPLRQLVLSPNPTTGIVRFNLPISGTYRIVTPEGRVVETGNMKETIDFSGFQNGVYLIEVKTAQEQRTYRAVKQD
jgi:hypothetical protein